jgi:outer membrane protein
LSCGRNTIAYIRSIMKPRLAILVGITLFLGLHTHSAASEFPELDEYINRALTSNLTIRRTMAAIEEKSAAKDEARSAFYPRLSLNARYSRAGGGRVIRIDPAEFLIGQLPPGFTLSAPREVNFLRKEEHDTRINLLQPLYMGGMIQSGYKVSYMDWMVSQAELDIVKGELIKEVSQAYFSYLMADKLVEISNENLSLAEEHLKVVRGLQEAESVPLNDVYRADVQAASAQQAVTEANSMRKMAGLYLNRILNYPPDQKILIPVLDINDSIPSLNKGLESLSYYSSKAELNRPVLRKITYSLRALDYLKKVHRAEYYPHLSLSAAYGWEGENYRFDFPHDYWNISLLLQFNIFDSGARKAKLRQVEAQKNMTEYLYTDVSRLIELEVNEAFLNLEDLFEKWYSANVQLKSAKENYRITEIQYESGLTSHIQFLDAQNMYILSRSNIIVLYYEILMAEASLDKACGSGLTKNHRMNIDH